MSEKKLSLVFLCLIASFGAYYIIESIPLLTATLGGISAGYVPFWLSIILVILCGLNLVQTLLKKESKDKKIIIQNWKYIIFTLVILPLYFMSWSNFGYFYIQTFFLLLILMLVYKIPTGLSARNVIPIAALCGLCTFIIYIIFSVIFKFIL
jgi:hypothetical protein